MTSPVSPESDVSDQYWQEFHKDEENESQVNKENLELKEIENEIAIFRTSLLNEKMFVKGCTSTSNFWMKHAKSLPNLFKLTKILLNIQASSAFIERFFSVCGIVCNLKNMNMKDQMIIIRSILKANIGILNELNSEYHQDD